VGLVYNEFGFLRIRHVVNLNAGPHALAYSTYIGFLGVELKFTAIFLKLKRIYHFHLTSGYLCPIIVRIYSISSPCSAAARHVGPWWFNGDSGKYRSLFFKLQYRSTWFEPC
jgi:hypothetical protein